MAKYRSCECCGRETSNSRGLCRTCLRSLKKHSDKLCDNCNKLDSECVCRLPDGYDIRDMEIEEEVSMVMRESLE